MNSTYPLDRESGHGVKADELAARFDDLFEQPDAKAVVFGRWTRMPNSGQLAAGGDDANEG